MAHTIGGPDLSLSKKIFGAVGFEAPLFIACLINEVIVTAAARGVFDDASDAGSLVKANSFSLDNGKKATHTLINVV